MMIITEQWIVVEKEKNEEKRKEIESVGEKEMESSRKERKKEH